MSALKRFATYLTATLTMSFSHVWHLVNGRARLVPGYRRRAGTTSRSSGWRKMIQLQRYPNIRRCAQCTARSRSQHSNGWVSRGCIGIRDWNERWLLPEPGRVGNGGKVTLESIREDPRLLIGDSSAPVGASAPQSTPARAPDQQPNRPRRPPLPH